MKLISHRGNINGQDVSRENDPIYVEAAILLGFDVEIDVHYKDGQLYTGHDEPQYRIHRQWLLDRRDKLWIHCKNIEAIEYFNSSDRFNFFWHQTDTMTLTSLGFLWVHPGKQPVIDSIAVMPEIFDDNIGVCYGVCSDFIQKYSKIK